MDNLPSWKSYPKRSRSIICSTTLDGAYGYGNNMDKKVIIPFDGSKIGLCADHDLWDSWNNISSVHLFISSLNKELIEYGISDVDDKSWSSLKKALIKLSVGDVNERGIYNFGNILKNWDGNGDFIKHIDNILSPKSNGFKLLKAGDKLPSKGQEAWVGGKCVIIKSDVFEEFIKGV